MSELLLAVEHTEVFARGPGGGNPCPVVHDGGSLSAREMQAVAAHYGEETAFILWEEDGSLRLRYFVPRYEMAMCVHATVAAVTVLLRAGKIGGRSLVVRTASGDCAVSWDASTPPRVTVEQQRPEVGPPADVGREVESAAGLRVGALDLSAPIRSVDVSRPKLIVPVSDAGALNDARPDFTHLWDICRRLRTTGAYLFAPHPAGRGDHVVARQFPVDAGYPEDPATGVAAAALAVYLAVQAPPRRPSWLDLTIDQGDAMGRPSRLEASAFADRDGVSRSRVSGCATLRDRERLDAAAISAPGIALQRDPR